MKAVGPVALMSGVFGELRNVIRWAGQRLLTVFGALLVIIGIPIAITPIPVGLPMVAIGLIILLNTSTRAKRIFLRWKRRYPITGQRVRSFISRRRK